MKSHKTNEVVPPHGSWIETYDGGSFSFDNPQASVVRIRDIAVSLSRIPRFNGHSKFHYTVGQHCVLMEIALRKTYPATPLERLHILLHDASEAYTGDMCRPLKYTKGLEGFRIIEKIIQATIYEKLDLPQPTTQDNELVHEYDNRMLRTEAENLMVRIEEWRSLIAFSPLPVRVRRWSERKVRRCFLSAYVSALKDYNKELQKNDRNK
jgi:hypothetical protein